MLLLIPEAIGPFIGFLLVLAIGVYALDQFVKKMNEEKQLREKGHLIKI